MSAFVLKQLTTTPAVDGNSMSMPEITKSAPEAEMNFDIVVVYSAALFAISNAVTASTGLKAANNMGTAI